METTFGILGARFQTFRYSVTTHIENAKINTTASIPLTQLSHEKGLKLYSSKSSSDIELTTEGLYSL